MTFLTPGIAALFAAVALPTLGLLYFLKLRRRRVKVPTTLLWQRTVEDLQVNTPFQKFKNSLLFWLQLLAVCLLLLALARPLLSGGHVDADRVAIIVDTSASMKATDLGEPRLTVAKRQALELINSLEAVPISVLTFHDEARTLTDFTTDRAQIRRAIQSIEPTDRGSDLSTALTLLSPAAPPESPSPPSPPESSPNGTSESLAVHVFTDGRIDTTHAAPVLANTTLVYEPIAAQNDATRANAGITAFAVRRDLIQPAFIELFAEVTTNGFEHLSAGQATAELTLDGTPLRTFPLTPGSGPTSNAADSEESSTAIPPLQTQTLRTRFQHPGSGVLTLRLLVDDALSADNTARTVLAPAQDLRVLIVTERSFSPTQEAARAYGVQQADLTNPAGYREAFNQGLPRTTWAPGAPGSRAPGTPEAPEAGGTNDSTVMGNTPSGGRGSGGAASGGYDLVIFDNTAPPDDAIPTVDALYLGAAPPLAGLTRIAHEEGSAPLQRVIRQHEDHPLMRYAVMDDQVFYQPGRLALPDDATILVTLDSGPAIAEIARQGVRHVVVSPPLTLLQDAPWQWPYQLSFLAFMQNVFDGLGLGELADSAGLSSRPGEGLTWPAAQTAATYLGPQNTPDLKPRIFDDQARFAPFNHAGLFSADTRTEPPYDQIAVNLLNAIESDTRTVNRLPIAVAAPTASSNATDLTGTPGTSTLTSQQVQTALWPWILAAALAVVLFEWWSYTRRMRV